MNVNTDNSTTNTNTTIDVSNNSDEPAVAAAIAPIENTVSIEGVWVDIGYPGNRSHVIQTGQTFSVERQGFMTNGSVFSSTGTGSIRGRTINLSYNTRYHNGMQAAGHCSGSISPDGRQMDLYCRDGRLGEFPLSTIRQ